MNEKCGKIGGGFHVGSWNYHRYEYILAFLERSCGSITTSAICHFCKAFCNCLDKSKNHPWI